MKKLLCVLLTLLMLVSFLPTVFNTSSANAASTNYQTTSADQAVPLIPATFLKDLTITIGSVNASQNEIITVPVSLTNVPPEAIFVFDAAITYDKTKLEYLDYAPGSIIKNPEVNFAVGKEKDGILKMLFLDYSPNYSENIISDGLLLNLTFKVLEPSKYPTSITISGLTFGDKTFEHLNEIIIPGIINLSGPAQSEVIAVKIGSAKGKQGDILTIPVNIENVPNKGIPACEMTVNYDPLLLEFLDHETGSIITDPTANFSINKLTDGKIKLIFLGNTTKNQLIISDGLFANLKFKILDSFPAANTRPTTISITDTTFTNIDSDNLDAINFPGQIFFTIIVTPSPTPVKKFTVTVDAPSEISENHVTIPVKLENVPNEGISSIKMSLYYDSDVFDYISYKEGSIVSNVTINKLQDGILTIIVDNTDTTQDNCIKEDGELLAIDFGVHSTDDKLTNIPLRDTSFLDKFKNPVDAKINPAIVRVVGSLTPLRSNLKITAGSTQGNVGDLIKVPVSFKDVPETGIGTAEMIINYDPELLEYVSSDAGSIIGNAALNFHSNLQYPGRMKLVFDYRSKETCINGDGIFATLTFKVLQSSDSLTQILISQSTIGNSNLRVIANAAFSGKVNISGQPTPPDTDTRINIGSAQASKGELVAIPVSLTNVNSIPTLDCTINYDTSKLNYDHFEAGSIVKAPSTNFTVQDKENGNLELFFLNFLMCNDYDIQEDGLLVTLYFRVTGTPGKTPLNFTSTTITNNYLDIIDAKINTGYIDILDKQVSSQEINVSLSLANCANAKQISVPVYVQNIPANSINSINVEITYDPTIVEYENSILGGVISDEYPIFSVTKEYEGKLKVSVPSFANNYFLNSDGVLAFLDFKVIKPGITDASMKIVTADFFDTYNNPLASKIVHPEVLNVSIGTVEASEGTNVVIPIKFENMPQTGVGVANFRIGYDKNSLEFISLKAGNIVPAPEKSFEFFLMDGEISILYLWESDFLSTEGDFAYMTFKVKPNSNTSNIEFTDLPAIGTSTYASIRPNLENGKVVVSDKLSAGYTLSGYISTDLVSANSQINEGFIVELSGTNMKASTDAKGYFEIKSVPAGTYNIKITKSNFLSRQLENVLIDKNKELSTVSNPLLLWAGDMEINGVQDDVINLEDIMAICKVFNSLSGDESYKENMDFNKDGALNLEDIMIISKHFNKISSDYQ